MAKVRKLMSGVIKGLKVWSTLLAYKLTILTFDNFRGRKSYPIIQWDIYIFSCHTINLKIPLLEF